MCNCGDCLFMLLFYFLALFRQAAVLEKLLRGSPCESAGLHQLNAYQN